MNRWILSTVSGHEPAETGERLPGVGSMLRRYSFTLAMLILLALTAKVTGSDFAPLAARWRDDLGFAPRDLRYVGWVKLVTSALVTHGGWTFWRAMAMVALFVGAAEHTARSRVTAATFWGVHLAVLALIAVVLRPPGLAPPPFAEGLLPLPRDVGPSVGCLACLGLAVAGLRSAVRRRLVALTVFAALIAALFLPPMAEVSRAVDLLADVSHLAGFLAGCLLGHSLRPRA